MFYADLLTREKIKAGKRIMDQLLAEGWEVHGAVWLWRGYAPEPDEWHPGHESGNSWTLHFLMPKGAPETEDWAYGRVFELRNACVAELYGDALFDDYFDISVSPPDDRQLKNLLDSHPVEHPLGERRRYGPAAPIRDCFVYNLGKSPAQKKAAPDSPPDSRPTSLSTE